MTEERIAEGMDAEEQMKEPEADKGSDEQASEPDNATTAADTNPEPETPAEAHGTDSTQTDAQAPPDSEELTESEGAKPEKGLEFLLDIPLELTIEVGRTRLEIRELLNLGPGSVVELDKLAGEPLDVYVNNKLIARGEVVVVNEKYGLKLTEVVSQRERIENLR